MQNPHAKHPVRRERSENEKVASVLDFSAVPKGVVTARMQATATSILVKLCS
jgi:hypothetical protein